MVLKRGKQSLDEKLKSSSKVLPPYSSCRLSIEIMVHKMEEFCWISLLSSDQIISIFLLLPIESIFAVGMACKRFRDMIVSDHLWESLCRRDWGDATVEAMVRHEFILMPPSLSSWRDLYKQVQEISRVQRVQLVQGDPSPLPRASHSLNFICNTLVLFGGGCEGGRHLDDTWVAYVGRERGPSNILRWQQGGFDSPGGRFGHTCNVVDDVLVLFGGINDTGVRHNDVWIGSLIHDETHKVKFSWRPLDVDGSISVPQPRGAHAGSYIGKNRLLIHGGIGLHGIRLRDTWLLELSETKCLGTWHEVKSYMSPMPRSGHTLTYIGESVVALFGGRGLGYEVLNDVWLFDMAAERPKWVELLPPSPSSEVPPPRVGHSATTMLGGKLLIFGGEDSYRRRKDDFWVLDPSAVQDMSKSSSLSLMSSSWNAPKRSMWKRLNAEGCGDMSCRSFHRACVDQSRCRVYIFGGMVDGVVVQSMDPSGMKFDAELYLVKLVL